MSTQAELDRLRLELSARDMEIIRLNAQIRDMRRCASCKHSAYDGEYYSCRLTTRLCNLSNNLVAWEPKP
ncbi:MAG TPA: hypothetical protein PKI71_12685 [Candidatus Rifleibacterium sp.]|nr:hypothetical protein [Candidatus Rifleibacterium sp.]